MMVAEVETSARVLAWVGLGLASDKRAMVNVEDVPACPSKTVEVVQASVWRQCVVR